MSTNLSRYLNSSTSPISSQRSSKKNLSPDSLKMKKKLKFNGISKRILMSTRASTKKHTKLSPETRDLTINLNKYKLEENQNTLRPKYFTHNLPDQRNNIHKQECDCEIVEVAYRLYTARTIGLGKIYISCKFAASNWPSLMKYNIMAVLSIGEEPNHYPTIKGGYFKIQHDGSLLRTITLGSRFLSSQLINRNVLVHCDSGNHLSGLVIIAFLQELRLNYNKLIELIKKTRPFFNITSEEETIIKGFENKYKRYS